MEEVDESVLEEARHRGDKLQPVGLVSLAERRGSVDGPGVSRAALRDAVGRLAEEGTVAFDREGFETVLENRLTDADRWAGDTALYEVAEGRVSTFPPRWHEEFGPGDDLVALVRVMADDLESAEKAPDRGGRGPERGVPEGKLLEAAAALSDRNRDDAKAELRDLRESERLLEFADQHPESGVRLPEDEAE